MISADEAKKLTNQVVSDNFLKELSTEITKASKSGVNYVYIYKKMEEIPIAAIDELHNLGYEIQSIKGSDIRDVDEYVRLSW